MARESPFLSNRAAFVDLADFLCTVNLLPLNRTHMDWVLQLQQSGSGRYLPRSRK